MPSTGAIQDFFNWRDAQRSARALQQSYLASEHGILANTQMGQDRVDAALDNANTGIRSANEVSQAKVNEETERGNSTLQRGFDAEAANLDPYQKAGAGGINALAQYALNRPQFSFNPSDLENEPGYQFQLGQGTAAVQNSAAARGLLSSGNTLQDLTKFGQGLAGTYYNDAFKRALSTFDANQNSTLANLSTLAGVGLSANSQFDRASENNSNQQAGNTIKAGYFGGQSDQDLAKFLSSLNLGGQQFNASLGLHGSDLAGKYAVGAGEAISAGIAGQAAARSQGMEDVGRAISLVGAP